MNEDWYWGPQWIEAARVDVKKFLEMRGSSSVECRTHNPKEAGSIPAPATNDERPELLAKSQRQFTEKFADHEALPSIELLMQLVSRQGIDSELWFTSDVKYVRPALRELTLRVELAFEEFELEHKANEMLVIERDELHEDYLMVMQNRNELLEEIGRK